MNTTTRANKKQQAFHSTSRIFILSITMVDSKKVEGVFRKTNNNPPLSLLLLYLLLPYNIYIVIFINNNDLYYCYQNYLSCQISSCNVK